MGKGSLQGKVNRRDRLIGLLRSEESWTTHALCEKLEVSHRTLMRDLAELKDAGYPIESERGRGGGIRLDGRWGIERLQLSSKEIISLLTSLAITESLSPNILNIETKSIRQKIARAFPESQRKISNKLRERILIGHPASPNVLKTFQAADKKSIASIFESFFELEKIEITYQSERNERTKRILEPHYLLLNWPVWYLLSWDELRADIRIFRTDRIISAKPTRQRFSVRDRDLFLKAFEQYFSTI